MDRVGQLGGVADRKIKEIIKAFIKVAKLTDLVEGVITAVYPNDEAVALALVDGKVHAFANVCTHDDGPLDEGSIVDGCVVCPRHGARFDLTTGSGHFPAAGPIAIHNVCIEGGSVLVQVTE